ncbi:MAG TPA: CDP-archaeol synthase [Candidatus Paceibacterota bacterium]|nr:CDP-archaeol synthase [Candidatus Paceibacterota bacterium]
MSVDVFLQSLTLFLPILLANQAGMIAQLFHLPFSTMPVSRRLLGENKTIAVYYVAPVLAGVVVFLYQDNYWYREALVFGWGAVLGDHVKSFVKRRLGFKPGDPWIFDRIDFAIGGALAAKCYFAWVTFEHVFWIVAIALPVHYLGNQVGFILGLRKTPH